MSDQITITNGEQAKSSIAKMLQCAVKAKEMAYCPYSHFRVGCGLLTEDGTLYSGCNVENASYGAAICAERTALVKAVSDGHHKFKAIAVATDVKDSSVYPCGICRQFMVEFGNMDVYIVQDDSSYQLKSLDEILPFSFKPSDLLQERK